MQTWTDPKNDPHEPRHEGPEGITQGKTFLGPSRSTLAADEAPAGSVEQHAKEGRQDDAGDAAGTPRQGPGMRHDKTS